VPPIPLRVAEARHDLAVDDLGVAGAGGGLEAEGPEAHGREDYTRTGGPEMETRVDEIAERIYRLSTFLPAVGARGLTFNQFLVDAEEPLLFHCGQRALFPAVSQAAARVIDLRRLRWIAFSHVEADECGALGEWLDAAPEATVTHGAVGCAIWLNDQAPRPPRALADGEVLDLGGRRVRRLDTPHVPHCWDAGLLYEETTGTLFTSDLFTHVGDPAPLADGDIMGPAIEAEKQFGYTALTPATGATIRRLAALAPRTLAVMHGSSFSGAATPVLESLAGFYDGLLQKAASGR
jgi:flavorubredoxin